MLTSKSEDHRHKKDLNINHLNPLSLNDANKDLSLTLTCYFSFLINTLDKVSERVSLLLNLKSFIHFYLLYQNLLVISYFAY